MPPDPTPVQRPSAQLLREAITSLDGPSASSARLVLVARLALFVVLPIVLLPTGLTHLSHASLGWDPVAAWRLAIAWWLATAVVGFGSAGVLLVRGRGPWARALTLVWVVGMFATNQMTMLGAGSMTTWGVLYVVALIAGFRASLDHAVGVFAVVCGTVMMTGGVLIEWSGVVPLAPFAPVPIVHPFYSDASLAMSTVVTADIAILITFFVMNYAMNQSLQLHRYITNTVLRRYLPPSMVERASAGTLRLDEPPERRMVTVLFSDLVGFTAMSERMGADAVAEHLNAYLSAMATLAHEHGATVDKFVGDAVMVVYGAPEPMRPEEQARRTVWLALEMVALAATLPGERLQLRVGINTGEAVVGNFGSQHRSDYTVIGPVVNLAARLEYAAEPGRVLVGPGTAALLDGVELQSVGLLSLKGLSAPVEAWLVAAEPGGARGTSSPAERAV